MLDVLLQVGSLDALSCLLLTRSAFQGIHLGPQPHKLRGRLAIALILELTENLLVRVVVELTGRIKIGHIVQLFRGAHVFVEVICPDVIAQRVGVREQELGLVLIRLLYHIVMELIHVQLTQVEDAHPCVDGLVQEQILLLLLDGRQVLVVDDVPVVQGRG